MLLPNEQKGHLIKQFDETIQQGLPGILVFIKSMFAPRIPYPELTLILVFFGVAFWVKKYLKTWFAVILSSLVSIFFLIMTFIDSEHLFSYLLFAVVAAGLAWKGVKSSGLMNSENSRFSCSAIRSSPAMLVLINLFKADFSA